MCDEVDRMTYWLHPPGLIPLMSSRLQDLPGMWCGWPAIGGSHVVGVCMVRILLHLIPTPTHFYIYIQREWWVAEYFVTFFVSLKFSYLIQHFNFSEFHDLNRVFLLHDQNEPLIPSPFYGLLHEAAIICFQRHLTSA